MYKPFQLFAGLRYLRSRRENQFLSFISWFSLIGLVLGVASLIIVMSVMNGFEGQLRDRILQFLPHGFVEPADGQLQDWRQWVEHVLAEEGVLGAAPYIRGHALVSSGNTVRGVELSAIEPSLQGNVSIVDDYMIAGELADLRPGEFNIVVGAILARRLRLGIGDSVTLVLPQVNVTPVGIFPRMRRFELIGVFEVGAQLDSTEVFINLRDGQRLFGQRGKVQGVQLQVDDIFNANRIISAAAEGLPVDYQTSDWSSLQGNLFQAVKMEKIMVGLMLFIIVAVAAFNIVAILTMMVMDKRSDIAVLRTLGASSAQVVALFLVQGLGIGILGIFFGVLLGVPIALNVGDIVLWLEQLFNFHVFDPRVYFITTLPSELQMQDVWVTVAGSALLSLGATLYPAWRAGQVEPAEVLRYE